jgi:glyoxylase-like metal-dependent hydrolase (beta-lactamase superfamily II)
MKNWFTIEQLDGDTFAISEYRHWEETHCYLLLGSERALLIDTGLGVADIGAVVRALTRLPVTAATTHVHWDHIGGHGRFDHIAVHELEQHWLRGQFPLPLAVVRGNLTAKPCAFPKGFDPERYQVFQGAPQLVFGDGFQFDLGGRVVTAVHTPGHSPGHCCFYEGERGYLYSGDLAYLGCLDAFYPTTDPRQFFESVQKISRLSVQKVLPGHHQLDVPASLIGEIEAAFRRLSEDGKLRQGSGVFDFGVFQTHI